MPVTMPEYSARPYAIVPVEGDAADLLNAVGDALNGDPRAIGAACAYDYEKHQVSAIFQVSVDAGDDEQRVATDRALAAFDNALQAAGLGRFRTEGWSVVKGGDPDRLP